MKPIAFPEQTKVLQKPSTMTDEECSPLPVYNDGQQSISCWSPTWKERLSILFFGRVWLWVIMGPTQPPVALEGAKTIFKKEKE